MMTTISTQTHLKGRFQPEGHENLSFIQIIYIHIKLLCLLWLMFSRWNGNLNRARSRFTDSHGFTPQPPFFSSLRNVRPYKLQYLKFNSRGHHISASTFHPHSRVFHQALAASFWSFLKKNDIPHKKYIRYMIHESHDLTWKCSSLSSSIPYSTI